MDTFYGVGCTGIGTLYIVGCTGIDTFYRVGYTGINTFYRFLGGENITLKDWSHWFRYILYSMMNQVKQTINVEVRDILAK